MLSLQANGNAAASADSQAGGSRLPRDLHWRRRVAACWLREGAILLYRPGGQARRQRLAGRSRDGRQTCIHSETAFIEPVSHVRFETFLI
jgi:hypothetical protein